MHPFTVSQSSLYGKQLNLFPLTSHSRTLLLVCQYSFRLQIFTPTASAVMLIIIFCINGRKEIGLQFSTHCPQLCLSDTKLFVHRSSRLLSQVSVINTNSVTKSNGKSFNFVITIFLISESHLPNKSCFVSKALVVVTKRYLNLRLDLLAVQKNRLRKKEISKFVSNNFQ